MTMLLKSTAILVLLLGSASAQSIAALLGEYQITSKKEIGISSNAQISGGAFDPSTGTILVVDNGNCNLYEIKTSGELVNTMSLSNFNDAEGIAWQNDRYFLVAEEARGNVVRIQIPQTRTGSIDWNSCERLNIGTGWANSGLEDVSCVFSARTGFGVKEKSPTGIFFITFDAEGIPYSSHEIKSFNWAAIEGDAAGVFALDDGNLLLLSQVGNTLYGVDTTGKVLSEIALGMTQPEGVTMNKADNTIYIVGEPKQLGILKISATATRNKPSVTPRRATSPAAHDKTIVSLLGRKVAPEKITDALAARNDRTTRRYGPVLLH